MKNLAELPPLVEEMLTAQKEFFRTKTPGALERAKRLEKDVQTWLREYRVGTKQPTLFDESA